MSVGREIFFFEYVGLKPLKKCNKIKEKHGTGTTGAMEKIESHSSFLGKHNTQDFFRTTIATPKTCIEEAKVGLGAT